MSRESVFSFVLILLLVMLLFIPYYIDDHIFIITYYNTIINRNVESELDSKDSILIIANKVHNRISVI